MRGWLGKVDYFCTPFLATEHAFRSEIEGHGLTTDKVIFVGTAFS